MNIVPYPFADFSLTPSAFANIAKIVAPGRTLRRAELADLVLDYHMVNGGGRMTTEISRVAKKALSMMASEGAAETTGIYGVWRISGESEGSDDPMPSVAKIRDALPEFVYAYYLPAYKHLAEARGGTTWPHKIGLTTVSVDSRVSTQVGTALPEKPVVIKVVETENSALLERAIHCLLEIRGRKISEAPGNEWFDTNLSEIEEILKFCTGK